MDHPIPAEPSVNSEEKKFCRSNGPPSENLRKKKQKK